VVQTYPSPEGGGWPPQAAGWGTMANPIARRLRKSMTPQEVKLWVHLRSWRQRGFHFRRQSPREGYIVDFVCMKHQLVIEVDGGQHNFDQHQVRDMRCDGKLTAEGFRVLRFWNSDIDRNLPGVLQSIDDALRESLPHPAASGGHPSPAGEG
jgi:very-short-patch-repair endonuclease